MKLLFDFLPLLAYFVTLRIAELLPGAGASIGGPPLLELPTGPALAPVLLATSAAALAALAQLAWLKARRRRVGAMQWAMLIIVLALGGLSVWLHGTSYTKWQPSVMFWALGLVLWLSPLLFGRNLLKLLLQSRIALPPKVWHRLNFSWVSFLAGMGLLNLWVAHAYSTDAWMLFTQFGGLLLLAVFLAVQALVLNRHALKRGPRLGR
jgi:intracellular septation protein